MIQMSMRNKDTSEFAFIFLQIGDIRNDIIRTKFFTCGEFHSCINDDDIILIFDEHALSYLLQTYKVTKSHGHFIFFDEFPDILDAGKRRCHILTYKSFRTHFRSLRTRSSSLRAKWLFASVRSFCIVFFAEINREISLHRRWRSNGLW